MVALRRAPTPRGAPAGHDRLARTCRDPGHADGRRPRANTDRAQAGSEARGRCGRPSTRTAQRCRPLAFRAVAPAMRSSGSRFGWVCRVGRRLRMRSRIPGRWPCVHDTPRADGGHRTLPIIVTLTLQRPRVQATPHTDSKAPTGRSTIRPSRCMARSGPASVEVRVRQPPAPQTVNRQPGPSGSATQRSENRGPYVLARPIRTTAVPGGRGAIAVGPGTTPRDGRAVAIRVPTAIMVEPVRSSSEETARRRGPSEVSAACPFGRSLAFADGGGVPLGAPDRASATPTTGIGSGTGATG